MGSNVKGSELSGRGALLQDGSGNLAGVPHHHVITSRPCVHYEGSKKAFPGPQVVVEGLLCRLL